MIALYADENVDRRIIQGLRRRVVDVMTAQDASMRGAIPDVQHLEFALASSRVLLTGDVDLLAIADQWDTEGRFHRGVIFYHQRWTSIGQVVREVHAIVHGLEAASVESRVLFVPWDRRPQRK